MEPGIRRSARGAADFDLSSEGIDGVSQSLRGLSIHDDEVVAPMPLVFLASQSQFSQIQESMREMAVSQNDHLKEDFQIPLKMIFINALKSVGIAEPVFSVLHCKGSFQVRIEFTSNLPVCIASGSRQARIVGDVCGTRELAEAAAIDKAFLHLREVHNVLIVDISYRKERSLIRTSRKLYSCVRSGLGLVDFILKKWHKCLDNLTEVQNFAYPKLKRVSIVRWVISSVFPLFTSESLMAR